VGRIREWKNRAGFKIVDEKDKNFNCDLNWSEDFIKLMSDLASASKDAYNSIQPKNMALGRLGLIVQEKDSEKKVHHEILLPYVFLSGIYHHTFNKATKREDEDTGLKKFKVAVENRIRNVSEMAGRSQVKQIGDFLGLRLSATIGIKNFNEQYKKHLRDIHLQDILPHPDKDYIHHRIVDFYDSEQALIRAIVSFHVGVKSAIDEILARLSPGDIIQHVSLNVLTYRVACSKHLSGDSANRIGCTETLAHLSRNPNYILNGIKAYLRGKTSYITSPTLNLLIGVDSVIPDDSSSGEGKEIDDQITLYGQPIQLTGSYYPAAFHRIPRERERKEGKEEEKRGEGKEEKDKKGEEDVDNGGDVADSVPGKRKREKASPEPGEEAPLKK
jgi:hypothetical protein